MMDFTPEERRMLHEQGITPEQAEADINTVQETYKAMVTALEAGTNHLTGVRQERVMLSVIEQWARKHSELQFMLELSEMLNGRRR